MTGRQWKEIASELNSRVMEVLCAVSGEKPIRYVSFNREVYVPDPTQSASSVANSAFAPLSSAASQPSYHMDCLAAGTTVWTDRGPLAIEKVESGDLVLSQHPETGELAYKPVEYSK